MANKQRKNFDIVLKEVRKLGSPTLVSVVRLSEDKRELWFSHSGEDALSCFRVDLANKTAESAITVKTRGERAT